MHLKFPAVDCAAHTAPSCLPSPNPSEDIGKECEVSPFEGVDVLVSRLLVDLEELDKVTVVETDFVDFGLDP